MESFFFDIEEFGNRKFKIFKVVYFLNNKI